MRPLGDAVEGFFLFKERVKREEISLQFFFCVRPKLRALRHSILEVFILTVLVEDAIIAYDKDDFFTKILERVRKRLEELGSKRVRMGRKWYWILKSDYRFGEMIRIG